ncbi:hypothetical protein ECP02999178_5145 [Escherichia coli P0299917.8]|nr:hypothetical protein ECP02999178_5145 [Escherichia coli P0299917.8]
MRINRVLHVVDIHTPDPESLCEVRLKDGYRELRQWLTNPAVSSNLEAGAGPPFQG